MYSVHQCIIYGNDYNPYKHYSIWIYLTLVARSIIYPVTDDIQISYDVVSVVCLCAWANM